MKIICKIIEIIKTILVRKAKKKAVLEKIILPKPKFKKGKGNKKCR